MDIQSLKSRNFDPATVEGEYNLVALWTKPRACRIIAGAMAGLFAATMMVIFGVVICALNGADITEPMRIAALPFVGRSALEFGSSKGIIVGILSLGTLSAFLGAVYAHFTGVNNKKALVGMGLTWAAFSWVFISCLFMPAVRAYHEAQISKGVMFFAWLVFGLSLPIVALFDKNAPKS